MSAGDCFGFDIQLSHYRVDEHHGAHNKDDESHNRMNRGGSSATCNAWRVYDGCSQCCHEPCAEQSLRAHALQFIVRRDAQSACSVSHWRVHSEHRASNSSFLRRNRARPGALLGSLARQARPRESGTRERDSGGLLSLPAARLARARRVDCRGWRDLARAGQRRSVASPPASRTLTYHLHPDVRVVIASRVDPHRAQDYIGHITSNRA
jgi:hypothetical protein